MESWLCPNPDCGHRDRTGAPAELPPEIAVCPHCGTEGDQFVPLVVIATFPEVYLAHLVRSRLEVDGIAATLSDEHLASMTHVAGDGGVKLRVRRDQVEAALAIMEGATDEVVDEYADEEDPEVENAVHVTATSACPRCAATEVTVRGRVGLLTRVFGVRRQCERCGNTWRA